MLRLDNEEGGDQKYYTYFKKPSDVSRMTFMVHKSNRRQRHARWIYVPAVDLVKPISADDKNSSFVGSDFSYEDVSGRHWNEDNHTLTVVGDSDSLLTASAVYVIESVPERVLQRLRERKLSYVRQRTLPAAEGRDISTIRDEMERIFRAEKIEDHRWPS